MRVGGREQRSRAAVEHGLGRGHRDDDVCLRERGVDPKRAIGVGDLDEILALGIVDLDPPVEAAREFRRDEELELPVARAAAESAGHEERLAVERRLPARSSSAIVAAIAVRRGSPREPGIGSDGGSTTIVARAPRGHERLERLAFERKAQRVANRGCNVDDRLDGRRRGQHDCAFIGFDEGEPRAVRQRQAGQKIER